MMAFRQFEGGDSNELHGLRKVLECEEEEEEEECKQSTW